MSADSIPVSTAAHVRKTEATVTPVDFTQTPWSLKLDFVSTNDFAKSTNDPEKVEMIPACPISFKLELKARIPNTMLAMQAADRIRDVASNSSRRHVAGFSAGSRPRSGGAT